MINAIAAICMIVSYVIIVCFIGYKIMIYLMDKIAYYVTTSRAFTMVAFAVLSAMFTFGGWLQLSNYRAGKNLESAWHIPLFYGSGLFLMVCLYFIYKKPTWGDEED